MRFARIALGTLLASAVVAGMAPPAGATLSGPCAAQGVLVGKQKIVAAKNVKPGDEIEVKLKDDVRWSGQVPGAGRRQISGHVEVELPFGQSATVGSWGGPSRKYRNNGVKSYDFPNALKGVKFRVSGEHEDRGFTCKGYVDGRFEGSATGNPAALGSIAMTALAALGVVVATKPKGA
jgi:hypothetical protein